MHAPEPAVVTRYFEADARRDIEAILSLFTDDAVVVDEGQTRRGSAEIRAWQVGPASKYTYTTEVTGFDVTGEDRYRATGRLEGNFPGGTADLKFDFTISGELISRLEIAP
jgi:ketosteroid isomerase-like protein